jgi:hypothetical protein
VEVKRRFVAAMSVRGMSSCYGAGAQRPESVAFNASELLRSIARAQQWLSRTRSRPSLAKGTVNVACLGFGSERFGSVETEV